MRNMRGSTTLRNTIPVLQTKTWKRDRCLVIVVFNCPLHFCNWNVRVTESVFKNYAGDNSELQRTQDFLENVFQSGAATCLICIATVKRTEAVSVVVNYFNQLIGKNFHFCISFTDLVMRALLLFFAPSLHTTLGERFDIIEENAAGVRSWLLQQSWRIDCSSEENRKMGLSQVSQRLQLEWGTATFYRRLFRHHTPADDLSF